MRLSRLRNTSKGSIHHLELRPAGKGKGFRVRTVRNPAASLLPAGLGPTAATSDPETLRPTQQAAVAQIGKSLGIPQPDADNDGDSDRDTDSDGD